MHDKQVEDMFTKGVQVINQKLMMLILKNGGMG